MAYFIIWSFLVFVVATLAKLIYDVQQNKKKNKEADELCKTEAEFEAKEQFQKLAGITPANPNDEIRELLVKNNVIGKQQIIDALVKAAENSEFPKPDESINVRTAKIYTIDTNFPNDNDPLSSVPMSRVSNEAKQKMAEIAREDINKQLEQNAEKFSALFPNEQSENDQRVGIELVSAMVNATKKRNPKQSTPKGADETVPFVKTRKKTSKKKTNE